MSTVSTTSNATRSTNEEGTQHVPHTPCVTYRDVASSWSRSARCASLMAWRCTSVIATWGVNLAIPPDASWLIFSCSVCANPLGPGSRDFTPDVAWSPGSELSSTGSKPLLMSSSEGKPESRSAPVPPGVPPNPLLNEESIPTLPLPPSPTPSSSLLLSQPSSWRPSCDDVRRPDVVSGATCCWGPSSSMLESVESSAARSR